MTPSARPNAFRKLFFGLFIFPLVIAVGMAVLLCGIVLMTRESETPESLIAGIKSGSPSKRWQKAYELSNELNTGKMPLEADRLRAEIIGILRDSARYDEKTRGYMALALGRFRDPLAQTALIGALSDPAPDVVVYALWSLSGQGGQAPGPAVIGLLSQDNPDVRKMAAYTLGIVGADALARPALTSALSDPSDDVRWNAALALARRKDASGRSELHAMLDRRRLESLGLTEDRIEQAMINAAKGLALIPEAGSIKILESLSRTDPSLKVRQAAITALDQSAHSV